MLKNKILFPALLCSFLLSGCSNTASTLGENTFKVSFYGTDSTTTPLVFDIREGKTLKDSLSEEQYNQIEDLTKGDVNYDFDGWYLTQEGADSLDNEEYFSFSSEVNSDLSLFAGYSENAYRSEIRDYIENYLGIYEQFDVDPLPLMSSKGFSTNDDGHSFVYEGVSEHSATNYLDSLVNHYGFKKLDDDSYLSKSGSYVVDYSYDSNEQNLSVSFNFNDKEGSFPTYFFASNFYGVKMDYYINDTNFNLADEVNTDDTSRFLTYSSLDGAGVRNNYIFYVPNNNNYDDLRALEDYLETANITLDTTSEDAAYVDNYRSAFIDFDYVSESEVTSFKDLGLNLTKDMVKIHITPNTARTSLDTELLNRAFEIYFQDDTDAEYSSLPTNFPAKAYSDILISSNQPLFFAFGVDVEDLNATLDSLRNDGWYVSVTGTTSLAIRITSSDGSYAVALTYYPNGGFVDANTSVLRVVYSHAMSVFETLDNLILFQTWGGRTANVFEVPEFSAQNLRITQDTSSPAKYIVTGYSVSLEVFTTYANNFKNGNNWRVVDDSTYKYSFVSQDDGFTLELSYVGGVVTLTLTYNAEKTVDSLSSAKTYLKRRLNAQMNETVINDFAQGHNVFNITEYFDGTVNRAVLGIDFNTLKEANSALSELEESLANNLTFYGTSQNVNFYYEGNLMYYCYASETVSGFRVGLVAYQIQLN